MNDPIQNMIFLPKAYTLMTLEEVLIPSTFIMHMYLPLSDDVILLSCNVCKVAK